MANTKIGEDLKIYDPLYEAVTRQVKGLSTVEGQKELDKINSLVGNMIDNPAHKEAYQEPYQKVNKKGVTKTKYRTAYRDIPESGILPSVVSSDQSRISDIFGGELANANLEDMNTRKQRILNEFQTGHSVSERNFKDAIKTQGLQNALDMFTSQLGAQTEVDVAGIQNNMALNQQNSQMQFLAGENELDRILSREQMTAQINMANMQQKQKKKSSMFGLIGNVVGLAAAPFTGGASLAIPAITSTASMLNRGPGYGNSGGLLGRY